MVKKSKIKNSFMTTISSIFSYLHNSIQAVNSSKMFAGLMIITLNIVSKFVTIKLSKTMESYLKFTFSHQILIFAIAWMGTRDIYVALFITLLFVIATKFLLHEDSVFSVLPDEFKDHHLSLLENEITNKDKVSDEDIRKAKEVLEKAKTQTTSVNVLPDFQSYSIK